GQWRRPRDAIGVFDNAATTTAPRDVCLSGTRVTNRVGAKSHRGLERRKTMRAMDRSLRCLVALIVAGCNVPALRALEEKDLKDDAGRVLVHYFVDAPANVAPASVTDPAKQVGVIACLQEHTEQPEASIYPVRMSLKRLGLADQYVLLAFQAQ